MTIGMSQEANRKYSAGKSGGYNSGGSAKGFGSWTNKVLSPSGSSGSSSGWSKPAAVKPKAPAETVHHIVPHKNPTSYELYVQGAYKDATNRGIGIDQWLSNKVNPYAKQFVATRRGHAGPVTKSPGSDVGGPAAPSTPVQTPLDPQYWQEHYNNQLAENQATAPLTAQLGALTHRNDQGQSLYDVMLAKLNQDTERGRQKAYGDLANRGAYFSGARDRAAGDIAGQYRSSAEDLVNTQGAEAQRRLNEQILAEHQNALLGEQAALEGNRGRAIDYANEQGLVQSAAGSSGYGDVYRGLVGPSTATGKMPSHPTAAPKYSLVNAKRLGLDVRGRSGVDPYLRKQIDLVMRRRGIR